MGSSTENSAFGPTRNPWDIDAGPGWLVRRKRRGGRCRAGAALRSAPTPAARSASPRRCAGSSGSSRPTASVSRYGLIAFASSLDQIGPFATTVADAALGLEVVAGHDPMDSTSLERPAPRPARLARRGRLGAADRARRRLLVGRLARVRRRGRRRRRGAGGRRSRGGPGLDPRVAARAARLLPHRARRGVLEPGPLRRRPLRPAGRRAGRRDDERQARVGGASDPR